MNNNSNIYVFDMGGVITKPSKIDMIYKDDINFAIKTYGKSELVCFISQSRASRTRL